MMMINPMLMACKAAGHAAPQTLFLCNNDTDIIGSRAVTIVIPASQHITGWQEGTAERNESYLVLLPYGDNADIVGYYGPAMSASLAGLSVPAVTLEAWIAYAPGYDIMQAHRVNHPVATIYVDEYSDALTLAIGSTQAMAWHCSTSDTANAGCFYSSASASGTNYIGETSEQVSLDGSGYGTYHHLAIVADGSTLSWYCDGTRRRQETYAAVGWPVGNLALGALQCQSLYAYSAVRVSSGVRYAGTTYATPAHPLTA